MSVPNTFASATSAIPLANLDADFAYYDAAFQIAAGVMEVNYTFRLEDPTDNTKKAEFVMSGITTGTTRQYTLPNATGTLATLANTSQTFTGSTVFAPSTNSGTVTIGGIPQTGTITLGRSTANQTVDIAVGATTAVSTKTVNIGTTGVSTSTTNLNYGSAVTGALVTHIWNAGANNMRLDSSGNLGIGTTSPARKLDVNGPVRIADANVIEWGGTSTALVGSSSSNTMQFFTSSSEKMRLDASGNLGIGTSSPSSRLHVQSATPVLTIQDTTSAAGGVGGTINFIGYTSGVTGANVEAQIKGVKSSANAAGELQFYTSDSGGTSQQRAIIDGSGNLGIGTSSPALKLDVNGSAKFAGSYVSFNDNGYIRTDAANILRFQPGSGGYQFRNAGNSDNLAVLDASGNLGLGVTPSATIWSGDETRLVVKGSGSSFAGTIAVQSKGTTNAVTGYFVANDIVNTVAVGAKTNTPLVFYTNDTERARIDASGNLGIGTTSPSAKLDVTGAANSLQARFGSIAGRGLEIATASANGTTDAGSVLNAKGAASGTLIFQTESTERMRLDYYGNLGIGTTANASAILDAQSTTKGVRMPNMTTTQKNAISSPAAGLMVFDTTLAKLCVYSGSAWQTITSI